MVTACDQSVSIGVCSFLASSAGAESRIDLHAHGLGVRNTTALPVALLKGIKYDSSKKPDG
jgi:hypothetical protein